MIDVYYLGASCFRVKAKKNSILINPKNSKGEDLKIPKDLTPDVVIYTKKHTRNEFDLEMQKSAIILDGPGEYEIKGVSLNAFSSAFKFVVDDADFLFLGSLEEKLTKEELEDLDNVDVLICPMTKLTEITISEIEPKIIVLFYDEENGAAAKNFMKSSGFEVQIVKSKFSFAKDKIPEKTTIYDFE